MSPYSFYFIQKFVAVKLVTCSKDLACVVIQY